MKVNQEALQQGDRRTLAKAITLVESRLPKHQQQANQLISELGHQQLQHPPKAIRLGISGTPGVGKSTFIETFGLLLIESGLKVAVLAIDPSSPISGGSILGDKTRMERLAREPNAFIRPSPSSGELGGVTQSTRAAMLLCEAAQFDVIIVETVGAGQSETDVANITDLFTVLMQPGGGDSLQGIKKGILEVADFVVVNKADGDQLAQAKKTRQEYEGALQLSHQTQYRGAPQKQVLCCSALTGEGVEPLWQALQTYWQEQKKSGKLEQIRCQQSLLWMQRLLVEQLPWRLAQDRKMVEHMDQLKQQLSVGAIVVEEAVDAFYQRLLTTNTHSFSPSDKGRE